MTRYNIRDATGTLQAVHVREDTPEGKRLWWERPDGSLGLGGLPVTSLPLYGSDEVPGWPLSEAIIVVEGEKAMEAICQLPLAVLGTVTGAAVTPTVEALRAITSAIGGGRTFILWPDHDEPGRAHMAKLAQALYQAGASNVLVIDTTTLDWPQGTDAADFVPPIPSPASMLDIQHHTERVEAFVSKYAALVPRQSITNIANAQPKTGSDTRPLRLVVRGVSNVANGLDAQTLTSRLDRVRATTGGRYKARCPAHEDNVASLTFCDGNDGRLLVFCHAGCTFEQVMGALA